MTDLTLYEYKGFSEEKLGPILQGERNKMFDSASLENDLAEAFNSLYIPFQHKDKSTDFIFQCWGKITNFVQTNIQKTFLNSARVGLKITSIICVYL